jgi:glycosyltransferase involved in cell wall biosynthesis
MKHLSIVIPVLNEEILIHELISRVKVNLKKITDDYEIVIVDDGSMDATWEKIKNESKSDMRVKGIRFSRNFGHHYAITAGLHHSSGEWVVVMDGDLQDRPEVIPDLYSQAQLGFDVVFVSRQNRPEKVYYKIAQKLFYRLLNITSGLNFNSEQANFSIISRKVVEAFNQFPEKSRFYVSTIKWLGFDSSEIRANHGTRSNGKPSYTLKKRIKLALDIIIAFSERPLKVVTTTVIILSLASLFISVLFILNEITNSSIETATFFDPAIFIFFGANLFFLGIIGVYTSRIYDQTKMRPLYIIREKYNF